MPHSSSPSPSPNISSLEQFLQFLNPIYQFCNLLLLVCPQPDFNIFFVDWIALLSSWFSFRGIFSSWPKTSTVDAFLNTCMTQNRELGTQIQVNFYKYSWSFMFPVQEVFHWKMFNILLNESKKERIIISSLIKLSLVCMQYVISSISSSAVPQGCSLQY